MTAAASPGAKLAGVFRFELAYQLRRAWTWLIFAALLLFAFLMTRDGTLAEALRDDFFVNSPFAIAKTTVVGSLIWLLLGAFTAGEAAARDVHTGMHPLLYTTPISKREYLGGRFLAAFIINALLQVAVQLGILVAVYGPGFDAALVGPFRPEAYLTAYAFLSLPNAFFATAIQFALATRSGRPMSSYLGSLLLFSMSYIIGLLILARGGAALARLLDPIGVHFILSDLSYLWTTAEKSTRLVTLEGTVLTNRLLWSAIAAAAMAATYFGFSFSHRVESGRRGHRARRREGGIDAGIHAPESARRPVRAPALPRVVREFGPSAALKQTLAIAGTSFRAIATSWAGIIMLVPIPLMTIPVVIDQVSLNGVPMIPVTARVLAELTGPLAAEMSRWVIVPLLIVFFAGELVWRERDARLGEISETMPGSEWVAFLGKLLGLSLLLALFNALLMGAGMLAQTARGYHDYEIGVYLTVMFGLQLPEDLLFAVLALAIHVLVGHKYLGHLAGLLAYVLIILAPLFGIEHNLLIYGGGPGWSYSEMRGFGASLGPWFWFKAYWAAWALLLAVGAKLMWMRGREDDLRVRLRLAGRRVSRSTALTAVVAVALIIPLGGFIFYNTNVLNEYVNSSDAADRGAEYERRYGGYADVPQPALTAAALRVEIQPDRRLIEIRATYRLENQGDVPIDTIHIAPAPDVVTGEIVFDRPATTVLVDEELDHRVYALATPLQPGESTGFSAVVRIEPRGFAEGGADGAIAANGTVLQLESWAPAVGYQRARELSSPAQRREHGLEPRPLIPALSDADASTGRSGGVVFDAVIGTAADQVVAAPGALRRSWTEGDRRYFHYTTDGPLGSSFTVSSAKYDVHEEEWVPADGQAGDAVTVRIFNHPSHTEHLERMMTSIRASLDYYTREFGPYPYSHLTVAEHPGNGTGMHADASMITHQEGFALWRPRDTPNSLDLPYAVVAHEMGHQWNVANAQVEGAPIMSESLAWYYGLKVVEHSRGFDQLRQMLRFMRQPYPYPMIRRGEPLLRGVDPYLAYRKGPFALYAVSEYVGEDRVNTALRRLRETHLGPDAPLATTLDLYSELRAVTPDSLQDLLHDLFEVNAYWEVTTTAVSAEPTPAGEWVVTLEVRGRKLLVDEAGVEREVELDEWVDVGVFGQSDSMEGAGELRNELYLEKHRIRSGVQRVTVTVSEEPVLAGVDPYHVLDWEEGENDDNIERVGGR